MNRRSALKLLASTAVLPLLPSPPLLAKTTPELTPADSAFLDELQRRACTFFFEQASPTTGQVLDRARAFDSPGVRDPRRMASIAATGFGLSALCVADRRGYIPSPTVLDRVRSTLRFHHDKMETNHGFFTHFNDIETGATWHNSEVSPIDTSLLLCGVLTARAYFHHDPEIQQLATDLYHRVDWQWMLNGGDTFAMAWHNGGFERGRWNHYCEFMMMYLLALGSPTHPIPASSWDAWSRPIMHFEDFTYISAADPLFVHQYSHAWFDFRHKRDKYANYFQNSITATRAHESFCLSLGKPYSPDYWGISASDSQHGYTAWGGPPAHGGIDGSVVPCATAGSLAFVPADCLRVLRALKENYGARAWGRYGFCDAFHPQANWYDPDVLGIDLGIGVLMAENLRTGFVWETFARNPEVAVAFQKAGFHAD
ncbi:MAG TPA: glucoamylase family protein [Acidobacteriaceae bacterium]